METTLNEISISYKPIHPLKNNPCIVSPDIAYKILFPFFKPILHVQEKFIVLYLNSQSKVIGIYTLATGGINGANVDTRLLLSVALKTLASRIIVAHNHPSGNPTPSTEDILFTKKLYQAAKTLDIQMLDHIIIGDRHRYISMAEEGLLV